MPTNKLGQVTCWGKKKATGGIKGMERYPDAAAHAEKMPRMLLSSSVKKKRDGVRGQTESNRCTVAE